MSDVTKKEKNEYLITVYEALENAGIKYDDFIEEGAYDSIVPACCKEGCEVEPDGRCEHGCPSVMLKLGVI
jgi:hypothetical protein